jgi:hypothetical protein
MYDLWITTKINEVPEAFGQSSPSIFGPKQKTSPSKSMQKKKKKISATGQGSLPNSGQMSSLQHDQDKKLHILAGKMKKWYINSSSLEDENSIQEREEEMKNWEAKDLTENALSLTLCFLHLNVMWKEKEIFQNIGQCETSTNLRCSFHSPHSLPQLPKWQFLNISKNFPN